MVSYNSRLLSRDLTTAFLTEYMQHFIASKVEAKKIVANVRFEEVVSRFW